MRPSQEPEPTAYWLPVLTEAECRELARGQVPDWLSESCRAMLEWSLESGRTDYVGLAAASQRRQTTRNRGD